MMVRKAKNYYHLLQAKVANQWYRFPSKNFTIIAVTGTDGKTTTASLIYHILKADKKNVALISTVGVFVKEKKYNVGFHVTTPSSFQLQNHIYKIKKEFGNEPGYIVLEVTSHAIDQQRVHGIHVDIGVLTNITHEHLDYHKTYDAYLKTKAQVLKKSKIAILNEDDQSYKNVKKILEESDVFVYTYGQKPSATLNFHNFPFETSLLGEFNRYNILAAALVCKKLQISIALILEGIRTFQAPEGRQDIIYNKDATIMIDFAHTPNALTSLLPGVRKKCNGRLIHVFGAASKRDISKRPLMGEASSRDSDIIILTAEDPRGEDVELINQEIYSQIPKNKFQLLNKFQINDFKFKKNMKYILSIPDRVEAIDFAVRIAKKGDWVVLTGKGHEKSMNYGNGEEYWDEKEVALNAIKKYKHGKI